VSGQNHEGSTSVGAEIAGEQVKRWRLITEDRAADFLADVVFVILMLLLFVWMGLWMLVH